MQKKEKKKGELPYCVDPTPGRHGPLSDGGAEPKPEMCALPREVAEAGSQQSLLVRSVSGE